MKEFSGPQQPQPRNGSSQNQNPQQHNFQQQQPNDSIHNGNQNGQKIVMRDNLHYAADSVSNAMSSLVRELNSGAISLS